ncbi:MAG: ribonuclease HII [Congregibacter sp.]
MTGSWREAVESLPYAACIIGVDEVGRGPLAGDVVAAAVLLDPDKPVEGLADSKKLSEKRRLTLSREIKTRAAVWAIARATPAEIDALNILQASLLAMTRAAEALSEMLDYEPDLVLVDGNKLPDWRFPARAVVKGDSLVPAISAASIIAKVHRDEAMLRHHERWPEYGFDRHKGYPTKTHLEALAAHGACQIHRRSFAPVRAAVQARQLVARPSGQGQTH